MPNKLNQSLLIALGLSLFFTTIIWAQGRSQPAQRWEYLTIQSCEGNGLNKYGDEGWELVGVVKRENNCPDYTLKRLKPGDAPKYVDPNEPPKPSEDFPQCNLTLAQAPVIRGLKLGITVDDLIELFPGSNPSELRGRVELAKGEPAFGWLSYNFAGLQHKDRLDRQSFSVELFDGKVTSYTIRYDFPNQSQVGIIFNSEQFANTLSQSLNLPARSFWHVTWNNKYNHGDIVLRCQGFNVSGSVSSNMSIRVYGPSNEPYETINQRRTEALAKKRAEFKP